ncbi:polyisoprenoid diphosphate/phosphate phosphohydrolase PLPP6 isoform X2 [Battus philenor]
MLQKILRYDVQITKKFVELALKTTALRSLRNHAMFLEVSCHGIVWLAGWLSFIWLFSNKELYQLQVNMLIALILDIVIIAAVKAFVRRRRPIPMNKLLAVGPDKYSFPSGHPSRAVLIAFILTYLSPVSIIFYPPLFAWVCAVAISRVLLERHYILDVVGGVGIGLLEGLVMSLIWLSQSTSASILSSLSDEKLDGGEYHV